MHTKYSDETPFTSAIHPETSRTFSGILGMPYGPFLYADDLVSALHSKGTLGGFRELVMFVEACESGSIFEGMLEGRLRIFATSAAVRFLLLEKLVQ